MYDIVVLLVLVVVISGMWAVRVLSVLPVLDVRRDLSIVSRARVMSVTSVMQVVLAVWAI